MPENRIISIDQLLEMRESDDVKIVDVRPVAAYNGWKLYDEKRGGHILGAKSLPAAWSKFFDWTDIVRSKHISPENKIVLYGYVPEETRKLAELFERQNYSELYFFDDFREWSANFNLPMDKLERFEKLVYPEWVETLVEGGTPPKFDGGKFKIVHAHYRNRDSYLSGHIPGAIDIDTLALESEETWNRRTPEELEQNLTAHGIDADTTVILYGKYLAPDNSDMYPGSAAGHIGALRCAFIMMWAGVKDVRVLNGGFRSWEDSGFPVEIEDVPKLPVEKFGVEIPARPEYAVDTPEAKEILAADDAELVSIRSWPEYIGEVSGYNYIEKKGRIPGSVFVNCGTDAYHMENYRNLDMTTREYDEIRDIWRAAGLAPNKKLAFYCGTGWRGSEAWFNAWLMGWPKVSVYDGGWFEWSSDPKNPFETGIPKL